jgi:hypothetical protein
VTRVLSSTFIQGTKPMAIPNKDNQEKAFPHSDDPEGAFIHDLRALMLEPAEAADNESAHKGELTH